NKALHDLSVGVAWIKSTIIGIAGGPCITGGTAGIQPVAGNLVLQIAALGAGPFELRNVLTYNSTSPAASEYGFGWFGTFARKVTEIDSSTANVTTGAGTVYQYTNKNATTGYYTLPAGAVNSLNKSGSVWDEVQPNGTKWHYDSGGTLKY